MVSARRKRAMYKDEYSSDSDNSRGSGKKQRRTKKQRIDDDSYTSSSKTTRNNATEVADASTGSSVPTGQTGKQARRLRGRLANLMNMPIDIFADICSHLHPLDLLHLSWASKTLRAVLMSKTSKTFWRNARENQIPDMPECPDILTEPQYAALAFTTVCQECGGTKGLRVYFALYSRYCARCVDDHILSINSGEIMSSQNSQLLRFVGWDCFIAMFPSTYARGSGRSRRLYRWTSKKVLDSLAEEWSNLKTAQEKDAFIESRKFIVDNLQKHTSALLSWQDEQEKRKSMTASVNKMARFDSIKERLLSMGWEERYLPEYTGFGNSAASKEWFRLVQKNQVLTERVWQNLYPKLVPILESLKADGMIKEREERARARGFRLMSYYQQLREIQARQGTHILFPQSHHWFPDKIICKITPIKKLIDDDGEQVTPERWNEIVPEVLDFLKSHTDLLARNILAWYSDSLKKFYGKPSISPQLRAVIAQHISAGSNLNLSDPTVVFQCGTCHVPLWYPALFLHHHCIPPDKWPDTTTWTSGMPPPLGLAFNLAMISTISQILGCLGIDLDSTTSVDLPAPLPNPYLSTNSSVEYYCCKMCNDLAANPMTMPALIRHISNENADHECRHDAIVRNGRAAFKNLHETQDIPTLLNDHYISPNHTPDMLWMHVSTPDEVNQVFNNNFLHKKQLNKYYHSPKYESIVSKYWEEDKRHCCSCLMCPDVLRYSSSGFSDMVDHVRAKHGIDVVQEFVAMSVELGEFEAPSLE